MDDPIEIIYKSKAQLAEFCRNQGQSEISDSILQQLNFLEAYIKTGHGNKRLLERINIGVLAAKNIEEVDADLAELLYLADECAEKLAH